MGNCGPIGPVEHTSTSVTWHPTSPATPAAMS